LRFVTDTPDRFCGGHGRVLFDELPGVLPWMYCARRNRLRRTAPLSCL